MRCHWNNLIGIIGKFIKLVGIEELLPIHNYIIHFTTKNKKFLKNDIKYSSILTNHSFGLQILFIPPLNPHKFLIPSEFKYFKNWYFFLLIKKFIIYSLPNFTLFSHPPNHLLLTSKSIIFSPHQPLVMVRHFFSINFNPKSTFYRRNWEDSQKSFFLILWIKSKKRIGP